MGSKASPGVLIMTESNMDVCVVYLAKETEDGTVSVNEFKRLPSSCGRYWHLPNGDLRIRWAGGDVVITTAGQIRMAAD